MMPPTTTAMNLGGAFPQPRLVELRDQGRGRATCTFDNMHRCVANAMRRTMLARLPVIGIPFEPYAKCTIVVAANTTEETDQSIWYRLGNVPVHSLDPNLVTDYAVTLDVRNTDGDAMRLVTTADLRLEPIDGGEEEEEEENVNAASEEQKDGGDRDGDGDTTRKRRRDDEEGGGTGGSKKRRHAAAAPGAPVVGEVFPPSEASNDHIALAELAPPAAAGAASVLRLRATFAWVAGSGAFAPNVVGYENAQDTDAADAAWAAKSEELRATHAREAAELARDNAEGAGLPELRGSIEETLKNAKHDFDLTGAKLHILENKFVFRYEVVNRAYSLTSAWRKAADILVADLKMIVESVADNSLEYWPMGEAASHGRTSVLPSTVVGGFGFDVILPGVDHTLGPAISHALVQLGFARSRAEAAGGGGDVASDRLIFCAFHQFTPDDGFGVIRLALARDEPTLVPHHIHQACTALVELFTAVGGEMKHKD